MRTLPLLVMGLLATIAAAGCLDGSDSPVEVRGTLAQRLAADVPALTWDGDAALSWWESFAEDYPKRDSYLPNNDPATLHLRDTLQALGLEVTVIHYPAAVPLVGTPLPGEVPLSIHTVVGYKAGLTNPDHAIAIGAHYDTQAATVQGAYDNAAGTAMVVDLCRHLAAVPMDKSLLCLFFDGEEHGVLGSSAYVEGLGPDGEGPAIDAYLGYDMTGMNWPGYPEWKLYNWVGEEFSPELFPLVNETLGSILGWPASGAEAFPFNDRNSDEYVFAQAGIPTIRFAGGRRAGDYDQYHLPGDTVQHVYDVVGGRDNFMAGFGALVEESYLLALMLDGTSLEELRAEYAT